MSFLFRALLVAAVALRAHAGLDADTISYVVYGDWGWVAPSNGNNYTYLGPSTNPWNSFSLAKNNYAIIGQSAVANAMAATCQKINCDFALNTGDNFYDMGVNSVQDPTWQSAFQGVYGVYPSLQIPHLSIFGNHDYLNDGGSMYPQIAYTYYAGNGPAQWWAPGRNWTASWTSASGKTGVNIVAIDTSPLIQAYYTEPDVLNSTGLYNGVTTGCVVNGVVINTTTAYFNPGPYVRGAGTGFAGGAPSQSSFLCGKPIVEYTPANVCTHGTCGCNAAVTTCSAACVGVANASFPGVVPSGGVLNTAGASIGFRPSPCHHGASLEVQVFSKAAQQAADMAWAQGVFASTAGQFHYQVLANHHPVLAPAFGRNDPLFSYVTTMLAALGTAAPQASFNGHDHVIAILKAAGSAYANTAFFTSGAAGTANVAPNAPGTSGCPAVPANASFPNVQPASIVGCGTWLGNNPIDPDSSNVIFGSNYNGYFSVLASPTGMNVSMHLVNCGQAGWNSATQSSTVAGTIAAGAPCVAVNGGNPVYSIILPPKPVTTPAGAAAGRRRMMSAADGSYTLRPAARRLSTTVPFPATFSYPASYNAYNSQQAWAATAGVSASFLAAQAGLPVVPAGPALAHAFNLTGLPAAAAPADAGSVGSWSSAKASPSGLRITPNSGKTGALTVQVSAYAPATGVAAGWYTVFNIDGVSFSFHAGPIVAAPGFNVSSLGVFTNGGAGCTSVFFIDASPAVNGKPVAAAPGAAGRRLAQTNGVGASLLPGYGGEVSLNMVFSIGATGKPGVPVDMTTDQSFVPIVFPATSGFVSTCAPVSISPSTLITVGASSATAPALPAAYTFFGVNI